MVSSLEKHDPTERRAAFRAAITLRQITMAQGAHELGISYNHVTLVLLNERRGSRRLEEGYRIAPKSTA